MLRRTIKNRYIHRLLISVADFKNKVIYGWDAPVKYQLLYVRAHAITATPAKKDEKKIESLNVKRYPDVILPGSWDRSTINLEDMLEAGGRWERYHKTIQKVRNGLTWEQVGHKKYFDLKNQERVEKMDAIIYQAQTEGTIPAESEINPGKQRERGGIGVLISSRGELLKGSEGFNRLGVAHGAGIEVVPVCVLAVHPDAIRNGYWRELQQESRKFAAKYHSSSE